MPVAQLKQIPLPDLFNPESHRLDASRIANALGLPVLAIATAINRKAEGVRKRPDAESLQAGLGRVYRIWADIVDLYGGNQTNASIFLNAPNPLLDDKRPVEFIKSGQLEVLESFIKAMNLRQPV